MIGASVRQTTIRNAVLCFALGCAALLAGFWLLVYRPSVAELRTIRSQTSITQSSLDSLTAVQRRHSAVVATHREAVTRAEKALSSFPREDDLPAIMAAVDAVARKHGARTELIDYGQIQWEKVLGRMQITALFSGEFANLGATMTDLQQVLPSMRLEQFRLTAKSGDKAEITRAGMRNSDGWRAVPVVTMLRNAFGLEGAMPADASGPVDTTVSPLHVTHLEAYVVFTVWLVSSYSRQVPEQQETVRDEADTDAAGGTSLAALLPGRGRWYPRSAGSSFRANGDPFRPSTRALELVDLAQLVEMYKDIEVTGLARSGSTYVASVEFLGKSRRVRPGDCLEEARVVTVDSRGVTLEIAGRIILINLGGENN